MNIKKIKNSILTFFVLVLFTFCLSSESQAAMSVKEVKSRLSAYSGSYVESENGICYYEYSKWDTSEEEMYEVISDAAEALMGKPVEDYCEVRMKFFFSPDVYGNSRLTFDEEIQEIKKKYGNFFTEWGRYNNMTVWVGKGSGKNGKYFSASFYLRLNGSKSGDIECEYKNPYIPFIKPKIFKFRGEEYDEKLVTLVNQAKESCKTDMEKVQFFLGWLDENAKYDINTGTTNEPALALLMGKTVCGGYANAFKDLCNASGIPAIVPVNMEADHAWSQVYVDGKWYTADLCDVVRSKSDTYNGYLFTDPDIPTDCNDFVEKHKDEYVESFKYADAVSLSDCSFDYKKTFTYTDKNIKPKLTVKYGSKVLKAGVHYNIVYKSNKYPGTGKIVLEGIKKNGYKGSKTLKFEITLPEVKIIATPGKSSVKLRWESKGTVDGYIIRIYNADTKKYEDLDKVKGNSCTVKNLSAGKKYKFAVRSYVTKNGKTYKGDNCKISFYTLPAKVKKLKGSSVTESSVKLKWAAVETAKEYEVQISTDGKNWKRKAKVKTNYYTVKKLSANKKYFFRVRAISDYGKGSYSDEKAVTTLLAKPEVKVVAGKGKITVKWNEIKGSGGYVVSYASNKEMKKDKTVTVKKSGKTKATVKGLKENKNYYVRVRAFKTVKGEKVYGRYSSVVKVKTK